MHKCQGMGQLLALPGASVAGYRLVVSNVAAPPEEKALFDGIDSSIGSLATFAGAKPPKELVEGLSAISSAVLAAKKSFDGGSDEAALQPLLNGLHLVRALRGQLRGMALDDVATFEVEFRLRQKEGEFQQAAILASGIRVDVLADDGVVVPGQPVKVNVIVANRGAADVTVKQVKFGGLGGDATCAMTAFTGGGFGFGRGGRGAAPGPAVAMSTIRKDQVAHCEPTLTIPASARVTEPYWHRKGSDGRYTFDADAPFGLPFRPTPFYVQLTLTLAAPGGSVDIIDGLPVQHRYVGDIFGGEKRTELLVVPALAVRVSPEIAIVPADAVRTASAVAPRPPRTAATHGRATASTPRPTSAREIRVTIVNDTAGPADSVVKLQLPQGWIATPPQQPVAFARGDQSQTVRFQVKPPVNTAPGEYHLRAVATSGGREFDRGYQVIEYPHISRYHVYDTADTTLKVIDVKTTPNLLVGYVMGVGDQVPSAIEQLGAKVEMVGADDLAWGDLSRFDCVVTGVRAYERRDDLRANNSRLLEYVRNGGTMIVQYNKFEFNDAQYGPYPAKVSSNRITDESAPVDVLEPENPVFTRPNRIAQSAWTGWVQERGLYFLGEKDPRYKDLVQMEDQFPYNRGVKNGALVEATYGKGKWVYVGLNFWRQLPQGVDGAYQLFANLLSIGKSSATVPAITGR
jgi:hypothetical protein